MSDPVRRHDDGSIDYGHYRAIARDDRNAAYRDAGRLLGRALAWIIRFPRRRATAAGAAPLAQAAE